MSALRLVVDNGAPTREAMINRAVRAAADACYPWGIFNMGLGEVLQRQLAAGDMNEFAREVRTAWHILRTPDFDERVGGRGL